MRTDGEVFITDEDFSRLDVCIQARFSSMTRSAIKKLIEEGNVMLCGKVCTKAGEKVKAGSEVSVSVPPVRELSLEPSDIPVEIVYQDADIAVVNKPQGMVVHPAPGSYDDTLVNALLGKLDSLSGINGVLRPGIVHRLDKDTSGLLVVAKNDSAHVDLQKQIAQKSARRIYLALLEGKVEKQKGTIDTFLDRSASDRKKYAVSRTGRRAVTHYEVVKRFHGYTLVRFELETGRTHQIRVHAKFMGHPVVGDFTYGHGDKKFGLKGQLLHAWQLVLTHPSTGKQMTFTAPLPDYFEEVLQKLKPLEDGLD